MTCNITACYHYNIFTFFSRCSNVNIFTSLSVTTESGLLFYVLLTVHLSTILDNDQCDARLLYFTIHLLHSSTCFEHYMLIIRRLNCSDATSGIVLSVSGCPMHRLGENCSAVLSQPVHRTATD